jgi:hypothetical protein
MHISAECAQALADVRVLELVLIGKDGGPRVRPMAGAWVPDSGQIVITTPLAYPQKAFDLRRDGRVALLFSDFTGSGISNAPNVLVQGTATAPDVVATPADLRAYWRELFRRNPALAEETADEYTRATMEWYYLRLPFYITPDRVTLLEHLPEGGRHEPPPDESASMAGRISDALDRYPSAVLAGREPDGRPCATRVEVSRSEAGELLLRTSEDFPGAAGQAALLWHRHNGHSGDMLSFHVTGDAAGAGREWRFRPERTPGALSDGHEPTSWEAWIDDGRTRTHRYLSRRGLTAPAIDWQALADLAPASR